MVAKRMQPPLLLFSVFCALLTAKVSAGSGSVELDEYSFDKILNKFDATLVKFDVAFPYGDKHDAFVALAKDSQDLQDLLLAEVGVRDYGEKDNEALARKYGATKENFPVVKLFIKGQSKPIQFDDSKGFTIDELRRFVREKTGIHLRLPGCVQELDKLAAKFMKSNKQNREGILEETKKVMKDSTEKDNASSKIYKIIMEKILEKGDDFTKMEYERVKKILNSKISDEKKKELGIRLNILQSFKVTEKETNTERNDL